MPGGRLRFEDMKDNKRLSVVFRDMPPRNSLLSMLLGCLAMFLFAFGYLALAQWMYAWSEPCAVLMLISTIMVLTFGVAHHVFCGMPEWLYVKMDRTEEARQLITEFFKKTSVTLIVCYLGFLIFSVSLFVPVVSGWTPLPRWACVFNILPLMLAWMPTRVGGSGNWAGAVMFLGLMFLL